MIGALQTQAPERSPVEALTIEIRALRREIASLAARVAALEPKP